MNKSKHSIEWLKSLIEDNERYYKNETNTLTELEVKVSALKEKIQEDEELIIDLKHSLNVLQLQEETGEVE